MSHFPEDAAGGWKGDFLWSNSQGPRVPQHLIHGSMGRFCWEHRNRNPSFLAPYFIGVS